MPLGDTKKLSIAVLVDGTYKKNEKGEEVYQPRTKNEIESIEDLVRKAAGINAQRGDQVVVTNMPFRKVEAEEVETPSLKERVETFTPIFGYIAIAGVIIFILLFIIRPLITTITKAAPVPVKQLPGAQLPVSIPGETQTEQYARQVAAQMQASGGRELTEGEIAREMARADSKQFADVLRNWIK